MGFPAAKNAHAFGNVCYKKSDTAGRSWGQLQVVPVNRSGTVMWARGHSSLYVPQLHRICVHYNSGGPGGARPAGDYPGGGRWQQCLDLTTQQWTEPQDLGPQIGAVCNSFLGSRQTNVVLPGGRQLWSQWSFGGEWGHGHVCIYSSDVSHALCLADLARSNLAFGAGWWCHVSDAPDSERHLGDSSRLAGGRRLLVL